jgi:hypothetical protein
MIVAISISPAKIEAPSTHGDDGCHRSAR